MREGQGELLRTMWVVCELCLTFIIKRKAERGNSSLVEGRSIEGENKAPYYTTMHVQ